MPSDARTDEKPLFIPLTGQWYDRFAAGLKDTEFRPHGPRWNERTCAIGRRVTLSRGYGKYSRMTGVVVGFSMVGPDADPAIRTVYPFGERFAAITIRLDAPTAQEGGSHE